MKYVVINAETGNRITHPVPKPAAEEAWRVMGEGYTITEDTCAVGHFADPEDCKQYPAGCKACYNDEEEEA